MDGLTGDPEIDLLVPRYPRLLPELVWVGLDRKRIVVLGTLNGAILPRRVGSVDLVAFAGTVDGTRPLLSLLNDCERSETEHRRVMLLMWFTHGLLEDGLPSGRDPKFKRESVLPFLARVADQTRIFNNRGRIRDQLTQPIGQIGATSAITALLTELGLNMQHGFVGLEGGGLAVCFYQSEDDLPQIGDLQQASIPTLICSAHGDSLRIGPMLFGCSTTSTSLCAEIHALAEPTSNWKPLWATLVANAVFLVHARAAPVSFFNRYVEYKDSESGVDTRTVEIQRGTQSGLLYALGPEELKRMLRQTRLAAPPTRFVGYKAYEAHYSRKYLAAAKQLPMSSRPTQNYEVSREVDRVLLSIVSEVFGYRVDTKRDLVRNCPTGGNLGSPEALILDYDADVRRVALFRYLPTQGTLECLKERNWDVNEGAHSFYVLAAVGNEGKAKYKYELLGENLVQLDAGIASSYLIEACKALLRVDATFNCDVTRHEILSAWINSHRSEYVVTWLCSIDKSFLAKPGVRQIRSFDRFVKISRGRRAWRKLDWCGVSLKKVEQYLAESIPTQNFENVSTILPFIKVLMSLKQRDGRMSICTVSIDSGGLHSSPVSSIPDVDDLICQRLLSGAPIKLFFLVNLPALLRNFGPSAHDLSLMFIGAWVGRLWLRVEKDHLRGCPAGAVAESEVVGRLDSSEASSYFSLFCFNIGKQGN